MSSFIDSMKDKKGCFVKTLANTIADLMEKGDGPDENGYRTKDLAVHLGISDSSTSQRLRPKDPVPFTAFELLRLSSFFKKPILEIIPKECWLSQKELKNPELMMKIGFSDYKDSVKSENDFKISDEEKQTLLSLRNLPEEKRRWILQFLDWED